MTRPPQSFAYLRRSKGKLGDRNDPGYQEREIKAEHARLVAKGKTPEHAKLLPPPYDPDGWCFADEDTSGYRTEIEQRVEGQRMLTAVQPGDWVFVHHVDRLGRLPLDIAHSARLLLKRKVVLRICGIPDEFPIDSIFGEMALFFFALGARIQSERASQNMKAMKRRLRAQGRRESSQLPHGKKWHHVQEQQPDGKLKQVTYVVDHDEYIRSAETICRWYKKGFSQRVIARMATQEGLPSTDGGAWNQFRVWRAIHMIEDRNKQASETGPQQTGVRHVGP